MRRGVTLHVIVNFFFLLNSLSQNDSDYSYVIESLIEINLTQADQGMNGIVTSDYKQLLQWHIDSYRHGIIDSIIPSDNLLKSSPANILHLLKCADIAGDKYNKKDSIALGNYKMALNQAKVINDTALIRFSYNKLLPFFFKNKQSFNKLSKYANEFRNYIQTPNDKATYLYYSHIEKVYTGGATLVPIYLKGLDHLEESNSHYLKAIINQIIGTQKVAYEQQLDSAIFYMQEAGKEYKKTEGVLGKNGEYSIYNNIGVALNNQGHFQEALGYLNLAKENIEESNYKNRSYNYFALTQVFKNLNNADSVYHYSQKEKEATQKFNEFENAIALSEIETKYEVAETEKQRLEEKSAKEKSQKTNLILILSIFLGSIIAFLIFRNTKRKQRIAEQEKELEIQKTTTLLKEQEITTINAMIEGQEKERLRLAGDLHDNLGGTLAAVKMHIGNLQANLSKSDNPQGLLDKANTLISEAYKDVRSIAHERNSGVMAKEGLLPAIEKLASKVSSSNGLSIEVQDFGLEDRLSNHIEITIFRIVQELITNIIKHAQATEATISLTQHDSELNIMVEDNGKGFKVGKLEDKDGMGLGSIERRVEHLEGTMEVDSSIGKGTNIIIDIPLIQS